MLAAILLIIMVLVTVRRIRLQPPRARHLGTRPCRAGRRRPTRSTCSDGGAAAGLVNSGPSDRGDANGAKIMSSPPRSVHQPPLDPGATVCTPRRHPVYAAQDRALDRAGRAGELRVARRSQCPTRDQRTRAAGPSVGCAALGTLIALVGPSTTHGRRPAGPATHERRTGRVRGRAVFCSRQWSWTRASSYGPGTVADLLMRASPRRGRGAREGSSIGAPTGFEPEPGHGLSIPCAARDREGKGAQ